MGEAAYGILLVCVSSFVPAVLAQLVLNIRPWKTSVGVAAVTALAWLVTRFPLKLEEPGFLIIMFLLMAGLALPLSLAGAGIADAIRIHLGKRRAASHELPTGLEK